MRHMMPYRSFCLSLNYLFARGVKIPVTPLYAKEDIDEPNRCENCWDKFKYRVESDQVVSRFQKILRR